MHDSTTQKNNHPPLPLPQKQSQFRINNCKFQNSIVSFFSDLHTSKSYTDVALHAEGKLINAHRIVLAAGSSYFNNLLRQISSTQKDPHCQNLVIALPNVRFKDLDLVIKFMYLGYLDIVNADLEGFVNLAKQLGVVGMSDDDDEETPPQDSQPEEQDVQDPDIEVPPEDVDEAQDLEEYAEEEQQEPPHLSPEVPESLMHHHDNLQEFLQVNYDDDEEEEDLGQLGVYGMDDDMDEEMDQFERGGGQSTSNIGGDGKPFICLKCGKTYNSNKSLWRHKKFTCDDKVEFPCLACGKVFSRSDNLRRHTVVAHNGIS